MIHLFQENGYYIVIDVNSGAIHELNEETYRILSHFDERGIFVMSEELKDIDDLEEILEEIEELKREGELFSEDIFKPMAMELKERQSVLKTMCLHVAHSCNMDCEYCFAGKGEYHGDAGLMSYETGKKAIDYLIENSPGRKNLEVDFFGGEPLLNWQVIKKLVDYGRSLEKSTGKNFRFTLTTNGLLIDDDVIDFCNREMSNVVLSLDGSRDTNDRMRKTKQGKGTYDLIVDKFIDFAKRRGQKDYYMRGTFTGKNLHFAEDIIHMANLGFKELSMEPVVAPEHVSYALKDEDKDILLAEYEKLALEMIKRRKSGNPFNFYHFNVDFEGGPCIAKRVSGCGVGTEYIAVTPEGDIYPCHQFVGDKDFLMGNLIDGIKNPNVRKLFVECNVYSHEECDDCFARLYCSGGCSANAYHSKGSVKAVYDLGCELHKKRIQCAIMLHLAKGE